MTAQVGGEVVTKGQFAEICGVSAGRVSQWISEGKIGGDALAGEGRSARIVVAVAQTQLKSRLDVSQRFGANGLGTRLDALPTASAAPSQPASAVVDPSPPSPPSSPVVDLVEDRIKREKLAQAEMTTRRMAAEEREAVGRYTLTSDVEREMGRIAERMMAKFAGVLPDMASAVAGEFGMAQRDVLHRLRSTFDDFRARAAAELSAAAEAQAETVDDGGPA